MGYADVIGCFAVKFEEENDDCHGNGDREEETNRGDEEHQRVHVGREV